MLQKSNNLFDTTEGLSEFDMNEIYQTWTCSQFKYSSYTFLDFIPKKNSYNCNIVTIHNKNQNNINQNIINQNDINHNDVNQNDKIIHNIFSDDKITSSRKMINNEKINNENIENNNINI